MAAGDIAALALAAVLFLYLCYALLRAERF